MSMSSKSSSPDPADDRTKVRPVASGETTTPNGSTIPQAYSSTDEPTNPRASATRAWSAHATEARPASAPGRAIAPPPARRPGGLGRRGLFAGAAVLGGTAGVGLVGWRLGLFDLPGAPPLAPGPTVPPETVAAAELKTARGWVTVDVVAAGVVRIRIMDDESTPVKQSYAIENDLPSVTGTVTRVGDVVELATGPLVVAINTKSGAISARDINGVSFLEESATGFKKVGDGYRWQTRLAEAESCHGLGERAFSLSLRDRAYQLWNHDAGSYYPGDDPLYLNIPFYLGHRPDTSYGLFWDNPARATIDLDSENDGLLTFECERRPAVLYVIAGPRPDEVVRRFSRLVGTMTLPPLWALGYQQSRWGYPDAAYFRTLASRMRSERIPCDVLHFDIDYMDEFRIFTWDRVKFPDPKGLVADLLDDGFHTVAIVNPGIKVDEDYAAYREAKARGAFLKTASGGPLIRTVWAGSSEFPDFTSPDARSWWAGRLAEFAAVGIVGIWNDMNEPSTFDKAKTLPDDTPHDWDGEGSTHVAGGHAVYGMQMARSTKEGLAAAHPDRRPYVISRAGYAGLQRHATSWNGDSRATWGHLRMTIPQLLNLGMSGIAFSGSDAGGFRGDPGAELYVRWMQLASMTPFFRTHSARTAIERNPWSFGPTATDRIRAIIERRYRLLPYFYTAVQQACADGTPIMRPLFFEDPTNTTLAGIDDEFLLGDHLLVAPILERGSRSRTVSLPPGDWYRFERPTLIRGGAEVSDTAGWGLPLYARAGAVIPTWPVLQSTTHEPKRLILTVYAGTATSHLYEDAGDGFGYADGKFRHSTFTTGVDAGRLSVAWASEGDYRSPLQSVEVRVCGLDAQPSSVTVDGQTAEASWADGVLTLTTGRFSELVVA